MKKNKLYILTMLFILIVFRSSAQEVKCFMMTKQSNNDSVIYKCIINNNSDSVYIYWFNYNYNRSVNIFEITSNEKKVFINTLISENALDHTYSFDMIGAKGFTEFSFIIPQKFINNKVVLGLSYSVTNKKYMNKLLQSNGSYRKAKISKIIRKKFGVNYLNVEVN